MAIVALSATSAFAGGVTGSGKRQDQNRSVNVGGGASTLNDMAKRNTRMYRTLEETRTFESLQRYGAAQAAQRGIRTEKDVEHLIREARA